MEDREIGPILAAMDRRIADTEETLHRSLYSQIDWDDRLICIKGAKGTGKTTMMLQYLKEHPKELEGSVYVSLDILWFANHTLQDVADWLHNNGGTRLFVDEVHHFKPWQTLIKNIYDDYPKLRSVDGKYLFEVGGRARVSTRSGTCRTAIRRLIRFAMSSLLSVRPFARRRSGRHGSSSSGLPRLRGS